MGFRSLCVLALAIATFHQSVAASRADEIEDGHQIAREVCARCHAIDPAAPWDSIGSTPSFMLMARNLDRYRERIRNVTDRRPHIAQNFDLSAADLDLIVAFVQTLND
jgi:mono/diheme cytochrome c family protein